MTYATPIRTTAILTLLLCSLSGQGASSFQNGYVVAVIDGDTVIINDSLGQQHHVRIAEIDAPEVAHKVGEDSQPFGRKSKETLFDLVGNKNVFYRCNGQSYGRDICQISVAEIDVGLQLVKLGMAWVYRKYSNRPELINAEETARANKSGLWQDPSPTPPWVWRHQ
jgi:endonuclease YncB( thermonuclease family)